jgi:hypothetical protein
LRVSLRREAEVSGYLINVRPDVDPRLYGSRKLSDLVRKQARHFDSEERGSPDNNSKAIYVRAKA